MTQIHAGSPSHASMAPVVLDRPLSWREIARIASAGAPLELSVAVRTRIESAAAMVRAIVEGGIRGYGVNTGVGALSEVIIAPEQQSLLSRKILLSHAVGVGPPLEKAATRAIMAAAVNLHALGFSGLRLSVVQRLVDLLNADCLPDVPRQGSVGYLSHRAHIGVVLIGYGHVTLKGERLTAADALQRLGLDPLILEAKEGLSLVNGTPCAAGLASLALERAQRLMDWADTVAAMSFETQRGQISAFDPSVMALHASPGLRTVAARLNQLLSGSAILPAAAGRRTQDALSLRAIPQVHGAVRDACESVGVVVERELESLTDNPAVLGSAGAPRIVSQAHAVGAALGLSLDQLAIAMAELGMISERRLDRMVNPLVNGLPAFLAEGSGTASGLMIAQYTAVSLTGENRRLAAPASLDGGITSGLQEDFLCHATPAALKALDVIANVEKIVAIELLAACQSYDLLGNEPQAAPRTLALYRTFRARVPTYADDRPLGEDIDAATRFIAASPPAAYMEN